MCCRVFFVMVTWEIGKPEIAIGSRYWMAKLSIWAGSVSSRNTCLGDARLGETDDEAMRIIDWSSSCELWCDITSIRQGRPFSRYILWIILRLKSNHLWTSLIPCVSMFQFDILMVNYLHQLQAPTLIASPWRTVIPVILVFLTFVKQTAKPLV